MLAKMLGWPMEVVIRTGYSGREGAGYPSHYKADLAHEGLKIAVEIDGRSHSSLKRQAQDAKKERFLRGLGWTVLRFTNEEVLENPTRCVQMVRSITSR